MTIRTGSRSLALAGLVATGSFAAPQAQAFSYHVQCQDCDVQQAYVDWYALSINRDGLIGGVTRGLAVIYNHGVRTELGTLGGNSSAALDLSDADAAVGSSALAGSGTHAFYWQFGRMRDLGLLQGAGFDFAGATGINNLGQIVGYSAYGTSGTHCFATTVAPDAVMRDIGLPPDVPATWNCTDPKVNNRGHMIAYIGDETWYDRHGYLVRDGKWIAMQSIDPDNPTTDAWGLNDLDQVVGNSGSFAFLWTNGVMKDLGVLPGGTDGAAAFAVNNRGHVVGISSTAGRKHRFYAGFFYRNGTMFDLNDLLDSASRHWHIERAVDINDHDDIVAVGYHQGQAHTLLLKRHR